VRISKPKDMLIRKSIENGVERKLVVYANWHTQHPLCMLCMPIGIHNNHNGCCVCQVAYIAGPMGIQNNHSACCVCQLTYTTGPMGLLYMLIDIHNSHNECCVCQLAYRAIPLGLLCIPIGIHSSHN
jgi:hypothetical protein